MKKTTRSTFGIVLCAIAVLLLASVAVPVTAASPGNEAVTVDDPDAITYLPECEAVDGEVLIVGLEERISPVLGNRQRLGVEDIILDKQPASEAWAPSQDQAQGKEELSTLGQEEKGTLGQKEQIVVVPFDVFYRVRTSDAQGLLDDLMPPEMRSSPTIVASLNYTTNILGHSGGESPFGKAPYTATVTADEFVNQAALSSTLQLPKTADKGFEDLRQVTVGVFDTAPPIDTAPSIDAATYHEFPRIKAQILADPGNTDWYSKTAFSDSRDHGIFVSSLVGAVAPDADVRLYRVLNDNGEGTTADIFKQVFSFLNDNPPSDTLRPVLNFSLGIRCDEPPPPNWENEHGERPLIALDNVLRAAQEKGAVIVGAAGNDSNRFRQPIRGTYVLEAAYPGSADFAISVGASNLQGKPACYSHYADVFAPGGDGVPSTRPVPDSTPIPIDAIVHCVPGHELCVNNACDTGMIGLSADSGTGYAFWSGTSFAAPVVSGLVARYLEEQGDPADVKDWILNCAHTLNGEFILQSMANCPAMP